jgi:lipoprotein NlpD
MTLASMVIASCASRLPQPVPQTAPPLARNIPLPTPTPQPAAQVVASTIASAPAMGSRVEIHTVQKGDTLAVLGMTYGVDYKDIAIWNQLENPNQLKIGQVLRVAPPGDAINTPLTHSAAAPDARVLPGGTNAGANAQIPNPSDTLKSAPKAMKLPYSVDALALVQNPALEGIAAAPGATVALAKPSNVTPEAAASPTPTSPDDVSDWAWPAQGKIKGFFSETNKGLDITGALGQPVMASAAGKVIYAGNSVPRMGKLLVISHSKNMLSIYAHNDKILVKEGQSVSKGQKIAEMGNTDTEQGQVKLHFEIRLMGKPVDPMKYLPGDKLS